MMNRGAVLLSELVGSETQKRRALGAQLDTSDQTIRNWLNGAFLPRISHRRLLTELHGIPFDSWDEPVDAVAA